MYNVNITGSITDCAPKFLSQGTPLLSCWLARGLSSAWDYFTCDKNLSSLQQKCQPSFFCLLNVTDVISLGKQCRCVHVCGRKWGWGGEKAHGKVFVPLSSHPVFTVNADNCDT